MQKWCYQDFIINHYQELESTNCLALQLIKNNSINHNQIILADLQTAGKGRMGKNWASPEGNLYFSLILKPQKPINISAQLSFLSAVAMGLTLAKFGAEKKINYKWPNDILIDGKKVAGILLESDADFVVLGVGVNIKFYPENTTYPATSLHQEDFIISNKENLLKKFLENFSNLYQKWLNFGFAPIRNLWLAEAFNLGKEIKVNLPGKSLSGVFKDVNKEGNLVLEIDGKVVLIGSGEVFF